MGGFQIKNKYHAISALTEQILKCAYAVHSKLGAGLLESVYEAAMAVEMHRCNIKFERQKELPVFYDGINLNTNFRLDMLVEECVILEFKAVEKILPVHTAQIITYMKLSNNSIGLILNFNVPHMRGGIRRVDLRDVTSPPPILPVNNEAVA